MSVKLEKRVARLAVSRFGVDPDRVRRAYQDAVLANHRGENIDLIDFFVRAEVLSAEQGMELRENLDKTKIDKRDLDINGDGEHLVPDFDEDKGTSPDLRPSVNGGQSRQARGQDSADALLAIGGYRILRKIGEGGMGTVYLAQGHESERPVAVKVLADDLAANAVLVQRFQREGANSSKLNHVNVVRGLDIGQDETTGKRFLVMEYVNGPSAQALLDQFGKLSVGDAVHIILDIAHALEHAQSHNIVHRDIKPENILLTSTGVAKLADMGLAKQTDLVSHLTATRQGFGTPYYMPYEQAINAKDADGRSDIFALGATLYHLVTGQVPFQGDTQMEILEKKQAGAYAPANVVNPEVPERLELILEKMLARDRRDRYQTASELIVDLERSGLAAAVPSFVDRDTALQDPIVKARIAALRQTTQPDLQLPEPVALEDPDVWYLIYHDKAGKTIKAKLPTTDVLDRIRDGRLDRTAQASHLQNGPYRYLIDYPLLRETLRGVELPSNEADADEIPAVPRWFWWLLAGGMLAIAALAVYLAWAFLK